MADNVDDVFLMYVKPAANVPNMVIKETVAVSHCSVMVILKWLQRFSDIHLPHFSL